jgi:hypothetical protein
MRARGTLLLALAALGATACGGEVTYSYFRVAVKVDEASVSFDCLRRFFACAANVSGADHDSGDVKCQNPASHDLGAFEFSSTARSGAVTFAVSAYDTNRKELARGESMPVGVVPNMVTRAEVVLKAVDCKDPTMMAP